jgi:drug/metabolite transporter (DMT)-like permease
VSTAPSPTASTDHRFAGLAVALASAAAFGLSGPFVKPLLEAGWSPAAAVAVRAGVGGLALVPFAISGLRASTGSAVDPAVRKGAWRLSVAFGVVAVAAMQLCYFSAVDRLPVGIALLIEYLGPVLLVAWTWSTTRKRPPVITLAGTAVATGGLFLVLDLTGASDLDPVGIAWAMGAAVCLACYFAFSAHGGGDALPALTFTAIGLLVGSATITVVALVGLVPLHATAGDVDLLDATVPWWTPMGFVAVVSTAFAYVSGVRAAGMLGARLASFVGLVEVVFAVLVGWILLDEVPTAIQAVGGALIVAGVVLVRAGEGEDDTAIAPAPDSPVVEAG